jgi:hypothetical protein
MRKISVLILALLVLVILPTWAVAGGPEKIVLKSGEVGIILIIDDNTGVVTQVYTLTEGIGVPYKSNVEQANEVTGPMAMYWFSPSPRKSPWHWCFANYQYVRCPD